jgi:hypothetical protein
MLDVVRQLTGRERSNAHARLAWFTAHNGSVMLHAKIQVQPHGLVTDPCLQTVGEQ